jgi:hypothetical protein
LPEVTPADPGPVPIPQVTSICGLDQVPSLEQLLGGHLRPDRRRHR